MGLVRSDNGRALAVNPVLDSDAPRPGSLGLISQSGSMLGAIMSRGLARGLGFSTMVSVGNEADIGVAELIEVLADDPRWAPLRSLSRWQAVLRAASAHQASQRALLQARLAARDPAFAGLATGAPGKP